MGFWYHLDYDRKRLRILFLGHEIACRVWKDYYAQVDAVVYLVDVYDKERFAKS